MKSDAHILIVDDDKGIRDLLQEFFEKRGLRTSVARDGNEMEATMRRNQFDLVILDVMLPGKSGLELVMTYTTSQSLSAVAGELWKANLETLGITLTLQPMAWEAQWQLGKSNPKAAQDIFVMVWWPTFVTPYDYLFNLFHSEEKPNFNLGYYSNPDVDAKIDEAAKLSGTDRPRAEKLFIEAQRKVIEDAAAVFMLDRPNVHIIRSNIKGYVDNPAYGHVTFVNEMSR